jgi:protein-tyrosine phosphatase
MDLSSIRNFRDAGGLVTASGKTIRTGMLYRSGDLSDATPEDLQTLSKLGIRTIVDLRSVYEAEHHPDRLPVSSPHTFHFPIQVSFHDNKNPIQEMFSHLFGSSRRLDYHAVMVDSYREYVSRFQSTFARVFQLALDPANLPMLVHCTAGKDRTGFTISLVQRALGLGHEPALENYLLSNRAAEALKETMRSRYTLASRFGFSFDKLTPLMEARSEYFEAAYDQVETMYSTLDGYLEHGLGINPQQVSSLKEILLEK